MKHWLHNNKSVNLTNETLTTQPSGIGYIQRYDQDVEAPLNENELKKYYCAVQLDEKQS